MNVITIAVIALLTMLILGAGIGTIIKNAASGAEKIIENPAVQDAKNKIIDTGKDFIKKTIDGYEVPLI